MRPTHLLNVVALMAVVCGAAAGLATMVPLESIRASVDLLTTNRTGDALLAERYARAVAVVRVSAAVLVMLAALVVLNRRRLASSLPGLAARSRAETSELRSDAFGALRSAWRAERIDLVTLACLVGSGLLLRLHFLSQPLGFDEALTYGTFASRPLLVTVSHYTEPNNHILHSVLVHLSCGIFGDRLWAVRLPALLAGLLVIPAAYWTFRLIYNRNVALVTAALVATLSPMVEFSTYARGYSLVTLLFVLILGLAAVLLRGAPAMLWVPFAALSAAGFYTVPVMLYPFGIVVVWVGLSIARGRPEERVRPLHLAAAVGLTAALTALLYLPVAVVSGPGAVLGNRWVVSVPWGELVAALPRLVGSVAAHWHENLPPGAVYVLLGGFVAGLWWHPRTSKYRLPVFIAALVWIATALAAQRVIPYVRTWVFLVPVYAAAAAVGLAGMTEWIERRGLRATHRWTLPITACALALWIGAALVQHRDAYRPSGGTFVDAPGIMASVEGTTDSSDSIVVSPSTYIVFRAYARLNGFAFDRYVTRSEDTTQGLVIVNESWSETPADTLRAAGITRRGGEPQLLARVGSAALYRW